MYNRYKERIKTFLKKKPDYKQMYDDKRQECRSWEYKYNTLSRQLKAIIKQSDA